jgi:16S rRNA C1402 (ribose-2'-O) methylase RsmI
MVQSTKQAKRRAIGGMSTFVIAILVIGLALAAYYFIGYQPGQP